MLKRSTPSLSIERVFSTRKDQAANAFTGDLPVAIINWLAVYLLSSYQDYQMIELDKRLAGEGIFVDDAA